MPPLRIAPSTVCQCRPPQMQGEPSMSATRALNQAASEPVHPVCMTLPRNHTILNYESRGTNRGRCMQRRQRRTEGLVLGKGGQQALQLLQRLLHVLPVQVHREELSRVQRQVPAAEIGARLLSHRRNVQGMLGKAQRASTSRSRRASSGSDAGRSRCVSAGSAA